MFASSNLFSHTSNEMGCFLHFSFLFCMGSLLIFWFLFCLVKGLLVNLGGLVSLLLFLRHFDPHNFSEVLSWQLVFGIPGVQHMPFSKGILSGEYSHTFVCVCLASLCVCRSFQAQPEKTGGACELSQGVVLDFFPPLLKSKVTQCRQLCRCF